ncbi:hypothetical protein T492DRAFT_1152611 [Pavlovales sp. CCMP2436]|nr:hypothetical protein T492DRAFT_1152611 [Pavlovales sp. CCMP2436]
MVFVLIPAALSASLVALRRPGTLGNVLLFRVSVFAASAAFAAVNYESQSTTTALQPAAPAAPLKKQLIKRRSSMLEPENEHAKTTRRSHPNKMPPGVAAYWDCAEIQPTNSSLRS